MFVNFYTTLNQNGMNVCCEHTIMDLERAIEDIRIATKIYTVYLIHIILVQCTVMVR